MLSHVHKQNTRPGFHQFQTKYQIKITVKKAQNKKRSKLNLTLQNVPVLDIE